MSQVLAFSPRLSSFSLAHLLSLSDEPTFLLSVSERTFYVLLNMVNLDIRDDRRWAVQYLPQGYVPVTPDTPEYQLVKDVREGAEREVYDLSQELLDLLVDIKRRVAPKDVFTLADTAVVAAGGTYNQEFGPVPDDSLWLVSNVSSQIQAGTFTKCYHVARRPGPIPHRLAEFEYSVIGTLYGISRPNVWLEPGDYFLVQWLSLSVSATVYGAISVGAYESIQVGV